MRELVAGGAGCAVYGASSSNPLGGLAGQILCFKQKQQVSISSALVAIFDFVDLGVVAAVEVDFVLVLQFDACLMDSEANSARL